MEERPLECGNCKKKSDIVYSEIVNGVTVTYSMCKGCPILQTKLFQENPKSTISEEERKLCCSRCQTTLESISRGDPLGCKECYTVFQNSITELLIETQKVAPTLKPYLQMGPSLALHIGNAPCRNHDEHTSKQLHDLNEALHEAIHGENYEQAAWLRDQINALMENSYEKE